MRAPLPLLFPALLACASLGTVAVAQAPSGVPTAQLQADAQKQLHGKEFRDVQIAVADGVVTLTGHVQRLSDKLDAAHRIDRTHEAAAIHNQIQVDGGATVSDAELFQKLAGRLATDREGYGTLPFNNIVLRVQNGVVTLGGLVVEPVDKQSAIGIVTNTPGVRDLIDQLQVAPPSPNDDRLRRALYNAVYGAPQLNRYALNPAKPIRLVVLNGHATLTGVVDNQGDKEIAGIRANTVPGLFSVTNDLQVAGQGREQ